jgi:hypothetical protein
MMAMALKISLDSLLISITVELDIGVSLPVGLLYESNDRHATPPNRIFACKTNTKHNWRRAKGIGVQWDAIYSLTQHGRTVQFMH